MRCLARFALLATLVLALHHPAAAQQAVLPLSQAQIALFETPHLASLRAPQDLLYSFRRIEEGRPTVEDRIIMEVRELHADGGRDIHPEFLTGKRRIPYPAALGFRGNPLLMFALDRDTRELAAATGGAASWFRNRIRRAFADAAALREAVLPATGTAEGFSGVEIEIRPFQGEPRARRYQERRYLFRLSEAVPGGIAELRTLLPASDGQGQVEEVISFTGSRPR